MSRVWPPSPSSSSNEQTFENNGSFEPLRCFTKSIRPPLYWNVTFCSLPSRSSLNTISRPLLRNAIVCSRSSTVRETNSVPSAAKIVGSGQNVTVVPGAAEPARLRRVADGLQPALRLAALRVLLVVALAVAVDLDDEALGQGVDDADADAVQAARHLVARAAELAAGVQHGEHHLDGALALVRAGRVGVDGDSTAVVVDPAATIGLQRDVDAGAVARPSLRRPRCRPLPRSGGAARPDRWTRRTCRGACARDRALRGPGCPSRRSQWPLGGRFSVTQGRLTRVPR